MEATLSFNMEIPVIPMDTDTKVNLIGNGGMRGTGGRFNNNAVFQLGDELLAVDFGITHVQAMDAARIKHNEIIYGFVTHFDPDHSIIGHFLQMTYWNFTSEGHQPHVPIFYVMPDQIEWYKNTLSPICDAQGLTIADFVELREIVDSKFYINGHTIHVIDTSDLHCKGMRSYGLKIVQNSTSKNIIFTSDIKDLEPSGIREMVDKNTVAIYQDTAFPNNPVHAGFQEVLAYYPKEHHHLLRLMHLPVDVTPYEEEVAKSGAKFSQQGEWIEYK